MTNPTPSDHVQNLLNEQTQLLSNKALLTEQLADTDKRLWSVRAALEGVKLGRALAEQEALAKEVQATAEAKAPTE